MFGYPTTILGLLVCWLSCAIVIGDEAIPIANVNRSSPVDFEKEIYPFLKTNCISCHNKTTPRGELNMETVGSMLQGGNSGPAIVVGKGIESLLLRCAAALEDPSMPPKENKVKARNLTSEQLGLLKLWIDQGAVAQQQAGNAVTWEPMPSAIQGVYAAAITRDGQWAACSRGGQIFVYHLPKQTWITCLVDPIAQSSAIGQAVPTAHRDLIPALAFSPDGSRLASGSYREVKIWKRHVTQQWEPLPEEENAVLPQAGVATQSKDSPLLEIAISANGLNLHGGAAGEIILWDAARKEKVRQWNHGSPLLALAANPDGSRVISAGSDKSVKLWDANTGKLVGELRGEYDANAKAANAVRWVEFCKSEDQVHQRAVQKHQDDLKRLVERAEKLQGELEATEKVYEPKQKAYDEALAANKEVRQTLRSLYAQLQPSEAGTEVPDAAARKSRDEGEAKLVTLSKTLRDLEKEVKQLKDSLAHVRTELSLAKRFVEKQHDKIKESQIALERAGLSLQAAEMESQSCTQHAIDHYAVARTIVCSPAGDQFAYWTEDERVHLASLRDGRLIESYPLEANKLGSVRALTWDRQGLVAIGESGQRLRLKSEIDWSLEMRLDDTKLLVRDRVLALQFSPNGRLLAVGSGEGSRSGDVAVWDIDAEKVTKNIPDCHRDTVLSLSFTHDGQRLATGSADKSIKVIATDTWEQIGSFEGHTSHVLGVAWQAGGRTLASAGADNVVKIWDVVSGDRKQNIENWDGEITSIQYVGLTGKLLTSSGDRRVRLLDEAGAELRSFPDCQEFMQCAATNESGSIVIGGSQSGWLTVWDGNSGEVLAQFPQGCGESFQPVKSH